MKLPLAGSLANRRRLANVQSSLRAYPRPEERGTVPFCSEDSTKGDGPRRFSDRLLDIPRNSCESCYSLPRRAVESAEAWSAAAAGSTVAARRTAAIVSGSAGTAVRAVRSAAAGAAGGDCACLSTASADQP